MAFAPAPSTVLLVLSALIVIAGFVALAIVEQRVAPPRPGARRVPAHSAATAGIVNMLTNDATLTAAGFRATVIDLAARGWLRILPPDEEDELARVRPAATAFQGDSLLPHERLALQHVLARYTSERPIPARDLAVDIRGAWWHRSAGSSPTRPCGAACCGAVGRGKTSPPRPGWPWSDCSCGGGRRRAAMIPSP